MTRQSLFFILTCGPENPTKATRCFQFAKLAKDSGTLKGIMLVDDAVYFTNPQVTANVKAVTGDQMADHMKVILDSGIEILCCKPCCATRNISEDDLPPGFILGTGVTAMEIASSENISTITF